MPARLKSFDLNGYKTFASRTEFQFADGITAIVGPNGSGKSNIADAIRWVLGEQSYGLLRGKKTEDMIFSGSEQRPRAGMAQATVIFDNGDGWLPIDFSEVAITRRAYRDGDNEYLLNGQRVRLKDVSELLAKSGLAERTYTIIGQGLVDAALALKAEERRRLFEEAAGIGLYRSRREESLRRLDSTKRNLERVEDILSELQPRLRSLERQARRVQEYDQIRIELQKSLKEWYGYHWHRAQTEFTEAHVAAKKQEDSLRTAQETQVNLDSEIARLRQQLLKLNSELNDGRRSLSLLLQEREAAIRNGAVVRERIRSLRQQMVDSEEEIKRQTETLSLLDERKRIASAEKLQIADETAEYKKEYDEAEARYSQYQLERAVLEAKVNDAKNHISTLTGEQARLQARLDETRAIRVKQQGVLGKVGKSIDECNTDLIQLQKDVKVVENAVKDTALTIRSHEKEYKETQSKHREVQLSARQFNTERDGLEGQVARLNAEIGILEQAEVNLSGYSDGSQLLLHFFGRERSGDAVGALGAHLVVPAIYEQAIAVALGENIQGVVLPNSRNLEDGLDLLVENAARGAIFPLDALVPPRLLKIDATRTPGGEETIIGVAAELVHCPDEYRKAVDLLLGQVIIVKDRHSAQALIKSNKWQSLPELRIATLGGELFSVNGTIAVGAAVGGVLSRPRQLRELKENLINSQKKLVDTFTKIETINREMESLEKTLTAQLSEVKKGQEALSRLNDNLHSLGLKVEKVQNNLTWYGEQKEKLESEISSYIINEQSIECELTQCIERISSARMDLPKYIADLETHGDEDILNRLSYWKTRLAVAGQSASDADRRYYERTLEIERVQKDVEVIRRRIENMTDALRESETENAKIVSREQELENDINQVRLIITPLEEQASQMEVEQSGILVRDNEARQRLRTAEHYHTQAKINLARRQEVLDSLRRRIEDDFGLVSFEYEETVTGPKPLPIDGMVVDLPHITDISPETEELIQRQRSQLKRLGPINFEAQSEYKEVAERYQFMNDQVADLHTAEKDIQEVIAELDILMRREFRRTFDDVAQEFKTIFTRLFNGGMARLVLTEPDNIAETGIDIEAKLPGRREQGLSLLSGGERSLTAVALVFALLRVAPTPFCILDEVDAMLDEANVSRFREMLTELSARTQFIVITHNRNTVQAAGVIYGVTMGRDSASQIISLKMDEVSEEFGV